MGCAPTAQAEIRTRARRFVVRRADLCTTEAHARMGNEELVENVYLSSAEGMNRKERLLGRWEDKIRVKGHMSEREVRGNKLEWARRDYTDRERW